MTLNDPTQPPDVIGCTILLAVVLIASILGIIIGIAL